MKTLFRALLLWLVTLLLRAEPLQCDTTRYHEISGLRVTLENERLVVRWNGESGQKLRASFAIAQRVDPKPS